MFLIFLANRVKDLNVSHVDRYRRGLVPENGREKRLVYRTMRAPREECLIYSIAFTRRRVMRIAQLVVIVLLASIAAVAQSKSPVSDVLRQMLSGREKNTVAAFEAMPADKFEYKPTPEQMTFGHLAAHIAESNNYFCANVGDVPAPKAEELKGTEGKEKLVAALKASFDFCHGALDKADDAKMSDNITWFDGKPRPRAWAFVGLASSWADHYGAAAMYLRLNGLLPPTAKK